MIPKPWEEGIQTLPLIHWGTKLSNLKITDLISFLFTGYTFIKMDLLKIHFEAGEITWWVKTTCFQA